MTDLELQQYRRPNYGAGLNRRQQAALLLAGGYVQNWRQIRQGYHGVKKALPYLPWFNAAHGIYQGGKRAMKYMRSPSKSLPSLPSKKRTKPASKIQSSKRPKHTFEGHAELVRYIGNGESTTNLAMARGKRTRAYNNNRTSIKRKTRRHKKKRSRSRKISKSLRRTIRSIAKHEDLWGKPVTVQRSTFRQKISPVSEVTWSPMGFMNGDTTIQASNLVTQMNSYFQFAQQDPATGAGGDIDDEGALQAGDYTNQYNKKCRFQFQNTYNLRNNSNFTAKLIFYVVQCTQNTDQAAIDELIAVRKATFSDEIIEPLNESFQQFWTVPGFSQSKRKWKMIKKYEICLNAGQEAKLFIKAPKRVFHPDTWKKVGESDLYVKGFCDVLLRQTGVIAHSLATPTSVIMGNSVVDMRVDSRMTLELSEGGNLSMKPRWRLDNSALGAQVDPVEANLELPGVGAFDNV